MSARIGAPTVWTAQQDADLTQLWAEGHSTAEIGRRIGMTKNSVIGRAHRISLPSRGNPISGAVAGKPRAPRPSRAHLPRTVIEMPRPKPALVVPEPQPEAPPPVVEHKPAPSLWRTCQWPTSSKRDDVVRFLCSDAPEPGRPYCACHCAVAYVPYVARRAA